MPVPRIVDDGSKAVAYQVGASEKVLPFFDRGDPVSWEFRRKMRVQQDKYKRGVLMQQFNTEFGAAYLVEEGPASPIGLGLLEYEQTLASKPEKRTEYSTIVYSFAFSSQQLSYDWQEPPESPTLIENPWTVPCDVDYEYFLQRPPQITAPRLLIVFGSIIKVAGWGTFVPGQRIAAEDSEITIYKGGIYQRKTPYIYWPKFTATA